MFNKDQVEGLEIEEAAADIPDAAKDDPSGVDTISPHEAADRFIAALGADIEIGGERACCHKTTGQILMPDRERFVGSDTSNATDAWYCTLLHELVHWTAHKNHLARTSTEGSGKENYAFEELIAEFGSAFLCAHLQITSHLREDHVQYIASWIKALKSDKKAAIRAASAANRAATYLINRTKHALNSEAPKDIDAA